MTPYERLVDWLLRAADHPEPSVVEAELRAEAPELVAAFRQARAFEGELDVMEQAMSDISPTGSAPELPDFELGRELGRGGMGVVYLAAARADGREVAIKLLQAGARASPELRARFLNEGRTMKRLRHPNIVRVYECVESNDPYFVMEYCPGGTLAALIGEALPWEPRRAAELILKLARAVEYAHDQRIIHRDLTPQNVLLVDGEPKISDFGLAKDLDGRGVHSAEGTVTGAPFYRAPEQTGRSGFGNVGPPTDVYGLGAILYHLLTGNRPFKGATVDESINLVCSRDLPRPVREFSDQDGVLVDICMKCLRKRPEERYRTAKQLMDDLSAFLEQRPVQAPWADPMQQAFWDVANHFEPADLKRWSLACMMTAAYGVIGNLILFGSQQLGLDSAAGQVIHVPDASLNEALGLKPELAIIQTTAMFVLNLLMFASVFAVLWPSTRDSKKYVARRIFHFVLVLGLFLQGSNFLVWIHEYQGNIKQFNVIYTFWSVALAVCCYSLSKYYRPLIRVMWLYIPVMILTTIVASYAPILFGATWAATAFFAGLHLRTVKSRLVGASNR